MEELATRFGENAEEWGMVGLLHDIDYELTKDHPDRHGMEGAKLLVGEGFSESFLSALRSHNNATGHKPANRMEKALYAVDPVSGFIVACALVHPSHTLHSLDLSFLLNRFKEKSFARGADRDQIRSCAAIDLSLDDFLIISLAAMQKRSTELGL